MLASTADCSRFFRLQCRKEPIGQSSASYREGGRKVRKQQLSWDSRGRGHLVLEGVGRDPVGALEENGPAIDAEVEAQPCGALQRLLDQLHSTEEHLQVERGGAAASNEVTNYIKIICINICILCIYVYVCVCISNIHAYSF